MKDPTRILKGKTHYVFFANFFTCELLQDLLEDGILTAASITLLHQFLQAYWTAGPTTTQSHPGEEIEYSYSNFQHTTWEDKHSNAIYRIYLNSSHTWRSTKEIAARMREHN